MINREYDTTTGLQLHGILDAGTTHWNLNTPLLYEQIIRRQEGLLSQGGALTVLTGSHTGRAASDKYLIPEHDHPGVLWWDGGSSPLAAGRFDALHTRMADHLRGKELYIQDCFAGASPSHRLPIRVVSELAWHSLVARNLFLRASPGELQHHRPEFTIIAAPGFRADPQRDGTRSPVFIIINLEQKLVLIGGTSYAGEIKKSVFTILNYLLPMRKRVLTMHCSANRGATGDVAIYFGLSGTGKTTLSTVADRALIGDDEHGWDEDGVFNIEGGCYAKAIRLSATAEPEIFACTRRFGTVMENVLVDPISRLVDLDSDRFTENTRAAYSIQQIPNAALDGCGGHPRHLFMLTCDAFGVLPPISRLSPDQAVYHFLSGYSAKVGGTENGLGSQPRATFSTCFGAPFMPLHPSVYADLLREKIARHGAHCWLVNTGWSGGGAGAGRHMQLSYSRAMIRAALDGTLESGHFQREPFFGLDIPCHCPDVPDEILTPWATWQNRTDYTAQADELANRFRHNFQQFTPHVSTAVTQTI